MPSSHTNLEGSDDKILPPWFCQPIPVPSAVDSMRSLLEEFNINTVCQSARCPNSGQCWLRKAAAFMILGDVCTRSCRFCAVPSGQAPSVVDPYEPQHIAEAVNRLDLNYVVMTSVTRDDLPDCGVGQFIQTIQAIRQWHSKAKIEVLIPDFQGDADLLDSLLRVKPDVIGHNIEMPGRFFPDLRPQGDYRRSVDVLTYLKKNRSRMIVKTGFMVGFGETDEEIERLLDDLIQTGCDILTIGQYLKPVKNESMAQVQRYVTPAEFDQLRLLALNKGFRHVVSGPLVRSSFLAEESFNALKIH
ncbi:MAG: lipoyl synthase [Candidatus Omnitrophica bacterium]|nr:lipoyl synthase [Candidatus Omnitrophota bacterium]